MDRQNLLPALWDCVRAQSVEDFEWLIHDGSPQPTSMFDAINDRRIKYVHETQSMTIGAKRNYLCHNAQGDVIVHFDDDDFYGPHYIRDMLAFMTSQNADFVKLFGFFLYQRSSKVLAYWDLHVNFPMHILFARDRPIAVVSNNGGMSGKWAYGFSYVFHRKVWEASQFPDQNEGEDRTFADAAIANFRSAGMPDSGRTCLHVIHATNTTKAFPQQVLQVPVQMLFPDFPG